MLKTVFGDFVDLFGEGSVIPELQDPNTWEELSRCLRKGGRITVNVGGRCVETKDKRRDGDVVMGDTLKAMHQVFGDDLFVLSLGNGKDDCSIALTWARTIYVLVWYCFYGASYTIELVE
ncbi:uncharacterized protein LOC110658858 [Hevea brasiliensis]|uniref:uncharacterized protein LOC110658858 n=1 Tax=Hevea brasiliensis TaxID=3981 RepID=UPI0025F50312|nr:uncharacterized protein LOC110658858 [Hevea brasiliensis]